MIGGFQKSWRSGFVFQLFPGSAIPAPSNPPKGKLTGRGHLSMLLRDRMNDDAPRFCPLLFQCQFQRRRG